MNGREAHLDWLARPILDHAAKVLSKDVNKSGQRLYDHWCKRTRKECFMASYQNEFFRAAYCMNRLTTSARSYLQAADRISADVPEFASFLGSVRHVISIGCGPGSDAIGLLAFLHGQSGRQKQQGLVFYLLDQCDDWADYVGALDNQLVGTGCSLWFKPLRFKDPEHEAWLPAADMIVFSFANTALMDPKLWPLLVRRYPLVLVLDSVRETLKEEYDDCKFHSFQLNDRTRCYYHLAGCAPVTRGDNEDPPPPPQTPTSPMMDGGGFDVCVGSVGSEEPQLPEEAAAAEATGVPAGDTSNPQET